METEERIVQNLKDAGCGLAIATLFLQLCEDGNANAQLSLLAEHRKKLLDEIHAGQTRLDCLDHLIYQMRKEQAVHKK